MKRKHNGFVKATSCDCGGASRFKLIFGKKITPGQYRRRRPPRKTYTCPKCGKRAEVRA